MRRRRRYDLENLPGNQINKSEKDRTPVDIQGRIRFKSRKSGLAYHIRAIGNSLFAELIFPAVQNLTLDFFTQALRMLLFGESERPRHTRRHSSYNAPYRGLDRDRVDPRFVRKERSSLRASRAAEVYEDIYFDFREDADEVLARMKSNINEFGSATVGDLRSFVGSSTNITYERYGWTDLRGVKVISVSDGFLIDFPEVEYLK